MDRKGGPEGVIDAVEALAPDGFTNIDDVMSYEQRMAMVGGYASTAGFARDPGQPEDIGRSRLPAPRTYRRGSHILFERSARAIVR